MKDQKIYFTPAGHQKYVDELNDLIKNERPEILKVIQWAASNGDRSENADYQYGKRRLREIDRRIRFLTSRLDGAVIVDPSRVQESVVRFGATVTIVNENDEEKTYQIVGPDEVDLDRGCISFLSPIGRALMGKTEGDEVIIRSPAGIQEFEILSIEYL